jgi:hypothetical protein
VNSVFDEGGGVSVLAAGASAAAPAAAAAEGVATASLTADAAVTARGFEGRGFKGFRRSVLHVAVKMLPLAVYLASNSIIDWFD